MKIGQNFGLKVQIFQNFDFLRKKLVEIWGKRLIFVEILVLKIKLWFFNVKFAQNFGLKVQIFQNFSFSPSKLVKFGVRC